MLENTVQATSASYAKISSETPLASQASRIYRWRRWLLSGGLAAAATSFIIAVFIPQKLNTYTTGVGEQRTITLEDGTRITMDTDTQLRVRFEENGRHIQLQRGQAYFEVAENPNSPLSITSKHGIVNAIGTAFSVFESPEKLSVTLKEGKVHVATTAIDANQSALSTAKAKQKSIGKIISLAPGEQLTFDPNQGSQKTFVEDLPQHMSWITGQLVFRSAPLGDIVDDLNRYSDNMIAVCDTELLNKKVDASFAANDIPTSILDLKSMFNLDAFYDENGDIELITKH